MNSILLFIFGFVLGFIASRYIKIGDIKKDLKKIQNGGLKRN